MTLKEIILAGDEQAVSEMLQANSDLVNRSILWGTDNEVESELLYFIVGLPFHHLLDRRVAIQMLNIVLRHVSDVNRRNTNGETALHGAVSYGEVEMARSLLDAGANINVTGGVIEGGTPLLLATFFGMLDCATLLIEHRATYHDLGICAGIGDTEKLTNLLAKSDVSQQMLQRALAFASINGQKQASLLLLGHGAKINEIAYQDLTALHWTAYRDKPVMAQFLLEKGADATLTDPNYDSTPYGWARYHKNEATCKVLEAHMPE